MASGQALVLCWALGMAVPAHAQRPHYRLDPPGAIRAGIYDPHPRLCSGGELSQRDLRVLRMGFGVNRDAATRLKAPWYWETLSQPGETLKLRLKTDALWDLPPAWFNDPGQGAGISGDPLGWWRGRLAPVLRMGTAHTAGSLLDVSFDAAPDSPWLWSRLHGSHALPRLDAWRASDLGEACPSWPAGVWLRAAQGDARYQLSIHRPERGEAYVIAGYRSDSALWSDFRRGHLDAVLVEGEDVASARPGDESNPVWGAELGTQQILLRPAAGLVEKLGSERVVALSQALSRDELSSLPGAGRFVPAQGFLAPLLVKVLPNLNKVLEDNPRDARLAWLAGTGEITQLSLATMPHPALEAMARAIAERWQRTLNVKTTTTTVPVDIFEQSLARGEHDWYLAVADLDDGSLQDLWAEAARKSEAAISAKGGNQKLEQVLSQLEADFLNSLPFIPLVQNVHYVAGREPGVVRALCPGCDVPVKAPKRGGGAEEEVVPPEG